jgi:MoaA/NifB/PqqE/SkfB family radical SAM enzyme
MMGSRLYNWIRYHFYTIRLAEWLLASRFFLGNPLYRMILRRGVEKTRSRPVELMIEPTNLCNLACVMCPHSRMKRERGVMGLDLFRNIADQAADLDIGNIKLAGLGEPLLDNGIVDKVAYAKKKNLHVKLFTNGMLLDPSKSRQLIDSGLDEIIVSIDGGTPSVQEAIRKGSDFQRIRDNLERLQLIRQERRAAGEKVPRTVIGVTYQEANRAERKSIQENWGHLADRIRLFPIHNWEVGAELPARASYPCHLPFFQMAICWDGRVALCCIDYECRHPLGDVSKESIASIWQGKPAEDLRKLHLECKPESIVTCRGCSMTPNWFFPLGLK